MKEHTESKEKGEVAAKEEDRSEDDDEADEASTRDTIAEKVTTDGVTSKFKATKISDSDECTHIHLKGSHLHEETVVVNQLTEATNEMKPEKSKEVKKTVNRFAFDSEEDESEEEN
jgi:hypothetical protein